MCGVAGILDLSRDAPGVPELTDIARRMGDSLVHRGPDAGQEWGDPDNPLAFAHRRLSIVDLTEAGAQPMMSACGRHVICYNGEIYNAAELRSSLGPDAPAFRGHSDTEAILECIARWGVATTVEKLVGMFAFAVWDRQDKRLSLVRDRLGIKPLYWTRTRNATVLFGSELRALALHPACPREIDRDAVAAFLRHNHIPAPHSIYRGVRKLAPGSILTFSLDGSEPQHTTFWSMDDVVAAGRSDPFEGNDVAAVDALEQLLGDAVGRRMIADVPLGAFLSGGIDSSAVVALMQARSAEPVRTFSIGFHEQGFNEAEHARRVAAHLGTRHTELYISSGEALGVVPGLAAMFDEPFADSSQIPTCLISAMTRREVTVALSGDGGDEVFAGYTRHRHARLLERLLSAAPASLRRVAARTIRTAPPSFWDAAGRALPSGRRVTQAGDKMHKLADVLSQDRSALYRRLVSHWDRPDDVVIGGTEPRGLVFDPDVVGRLSEPTERMQYLDTLTYLPDDILTKVDRASMAVSLEARVPLLDHRVVEFAWRLPLRFKLRAGKSKWLLRQVLYRHVPPHLVERPKMGFGVPLGEWLRGPLRDWAENLLSEQTFGRHDILRAGPVRKKWREHLSGAGNWSHLIWGVLMLHAWLDENHPG